MRMLMRRSPFGEAAATPPVELVLIPEPIALSPLLPLLASLPLRNESALTTRIDMRRIYQA
jgi:hypothetical protein|tara:strand:- start:337 stop:519 length:183 start_codon:yes stop_codon:yes gene_type:complete